MENQKRGRKAQIAIFVIIGIVLVVIAAVIFIVFRATPPGIDPIEEPQEYIASCVREPLILYEAEIFRTNGYPEKNVTNYYEYKGERIPYLCITSEFYTQCIPQDPMFVGRIRKDIYNHMDSVVKDCFDNLIASFERKGYDVDEDELNMSIDLIKDKIKLDIDKRLTLTKGDRALSYTSFKAEIESPLYNLASLVQTIVNYETTYCDFDSVNWMRGYPDISIRRYSGSEQTKSYIIMDRDTEKTLKFAIKTCPLPAGV